MKKISAKTFWKKLILAILTPDEQKEIWKAHSSLTGNESTEDLRQMIKRYGELTAKTIGCQCPHDFIEHNEATWKLLYDFIGTEGSKPMVESTEEQRRSFRQKVGRIGARFARQRKCHFLRRGVVCYCDEHNH